MRRTLTAVGLSAVFAAGLVGCQSEPKMGRYTYEVTVDESLDQGVVVSFVGPPKDEADAWAGRSAAAFYNTPAYRQREDVYDRMRFGPGRSSTQQLTASDPIWNRWTDGGAEKVFIYVASSGFDDGARTEHVTSLEVTDTRSSGSTVSFVVDETGIREVAGPELK